MTEDRKCGSPGCSMCDETSEEYAERKGYAKAQEYLDQLRMGDTHSSDVDPVDPYR